MWYTESQQESMPKPSHGSEPMRTSFALLRSALVCLKGSRTRECHVTLRMLILTSKLLKEPFNRTIDVFPYF